MENLRTKADKLQAFLYILARDHLNLGQIESIMENHIEKLVEPEIIYTNGHLAKYSIELADRLDKVKKPQKPNN